MTREDRIKALAKEIGFSLVGIAGVTPLEESNRAFERWLGEGRHGEMGYLERHREKRGDPRLLMENARSAICLAVNYYHPIEKQQRLMNGDDGRGVFSIYVHGEDYHDVMGGMLEELRSKLCSTFPGMEAVACVDTKPVSDRALAMRAGIAWLGKNTNVISPEYGSWIFLGELVTDLDLQPDTPLESLCGACSRCIDACPTGALDTPFSLDARKCISYLTIEKRNEIPAEAHEPIGVDVYGCDTCQSVCPFNHVAQETVVFNRSNRSRVIDMTLDELVELSDDRFRELTRGSAIRRCKADGLRRNARIVQDNVENGFTVAKSRRSSKRLR